MRKIIYLLLVLVLLMATLSGIANADKPSNCSEAVEGDNQANALSGTACDSTIYGYAGNDQISDTATQDRDSINGGKGADIINVDDGNSPNDADIVDCGKRDGKKDTVRANANDTLSHCGKDHVVIH